MSSQKNKLVIDPHGRNHFKFMPYKDRVLPESEKEQLIMIENLYNDLVKNGVIIYTKSKKGSFTIKCVKHTEFYYIVICMKNEFGTYNNVIHEIKSENDAMAICKMIGKNITTIMNDYKKQILDAKKMVVRKEDKDEIRKTGENDNE